MTRTHRSSSSFFLRVCVAFFIGVAAILMMGMEDCGMDEPTRCEQMAGYCAPADEMCAMNHEPMEGMGCLMEDMERCCLPMNSCDGEVDCAAPSAPMCCSMKLVDDLE